jgi:hypothetical protein
MREKINTHHFKRYKKFIQSRTHETSRTGYVENHHIIPNSVFKNNVKIALTAREHFIAHKLLTKVFKKNTIPWFKMAKAFQLMFCVSDSHSRTLTYIKSRDYEYSKKLQSEAMKLYNPMRNPEVVSIAAANMRKSWTSERRAAQAERTRGKTLSTTAKEKLSALWTGVPKPKTPEQVAKIVKASAMGLFVTPWGEFDSPGQASRAEGNTAGLSRYLINKYCKDPNNPEYSFISYGKVETRGHWKKSK